MSYGGENTSQTLGRDLLAVVWRQRESRGACGGGTARDPVYRPGRSGRRSERLSLPSARCLPTTTRRRRRFVAWPGRSPIRRYGSDLNHCPPGPSIRTASASRPASRVRSRARPVAWCLGGRDGGVAIVPTCSGSASTGRSRSESPRSCATRNCPRPRPERYHATSTARARPTPESLTGCTSPISTSIKSCWRLHRSVWTFLRRRSWRSLGDTSLAGSQHPQKGPDRNRAERTINREPSEPCQLCPQ
jgi:hypothetical protein